VVREEERPETDETIRRLMGNRPEARFAFISERAEFVDDELLDV